MEKKKYFIRGLGIGILSAILIMGIGLREEKTKEVKTKSYKGQVKEASIASQEMIGTTKNDVDSKNEENKIKKESKKTNKKAKKEIGKITIKDGMTSEKVAKELEKKGIITDKTDFNRYLIESGCEAKLRNGTFEIKKGSSYKKIMKIITKKDK